MDDSRPSSSPRPRNPGAWPDELVEVFERSITVEYASLTRDGRPVTVPTTPYMGDDRLTLDVSTGLTYPAKAERARRDPRVCLLFADPVGSGLADPPVVLVQGLATVRDWDLQANTDRYVHRSMDKLPAATKGQPAFVLRRLAWYYARIWIEVTPLHMQWWERRSLDAPPRTWNAPEGTAAPLSDPAPSGLQPGAWIDPAGVVAHGGAGRRAARHPRPHRGGRQRLPALSPGPPHRARRRRLPAHPRRGRPRGSGRPRLPDRALASRDLHRPGEPDDHRDGGATG